MACITFEKARKKWRVLWRAKAQSGPHAGEIFSGSRMFLEKQRAAKFYADIMEQETQWREGLGDVRHSVRAAADAFEDYCKRHTVRTQGHYASVMQWFLASLRIDKFSQLEAHHIKRYLQRLQGVNRTRNAHLTAIKAFCKFASQEYRLRNVASEVKMYHEDPPNARFLTEAEYNAILKVAEGAALDRIVFIANTGLRASEITALTWGCVRDGSLVFTGKGRKRRTVPLNKTCKELLFRLRTQNKPISKDPILLSKSGGAVRREALYKQFAGLAKKADIEKWGPHALRHYFASRLFMAGVNIGVVSKILGHSSISVTEKIYIHVLQEHLKGATDVLDRPPEKMP